MSKILEIDGLTKYFGGLCASNNISYSLMEGELKTIIGPNGAGKTTFISQISGHHTSTSGTIKYKNKDITTASLIKRARLGIIRKFQTPSLYLGLTVYQNIEIAVLGTRCPYRLRNKRIFSILEDIKLVDQAYTYVSNLSHGQMQWAEIGLLLGREANVLLLDEPTAGMTPEESFATGELIKRIIDEKRLSGIVIEHDMEFVKSLDSSVSVLHLGELVAEGTYSEVENNEFVRKIYLGE